MGDSERRAESQAFSEHHYFKTGFTLGKLLHCSANFSKVIAIRRGSACSTFVQCSILEGAKYIRPGLHASAPLTR